MTPPRAPPLGRLLFLYVGTADFARDLAWYRGVLGAERVWAFARFGARVAALRVSHGPLLLLADHKKPGCQPIYGVPDLAAAEAALRARGWRADGEAFGTPNGPCVRFVDPSGNEFALLQDDCPEAMERAWADAENPHALRD